MMPFYICSSIKKYAIYINSRIGVPLLVNILRNRYVQNVLPVIKCTSNAILFCLFQDVFGWDFFFLVIFISFTWYYVDCNSSIVIHDALFKRSMLWKWASSEFLPFGCVCHNHPALIVYMDLSCATFDSSCQMQIRTHHLNEVVMHAIKSHLCCICTEVHLNVSIICIAL